MAGKGVRYDAKIVTSTLSWHICEVFARGNAEIGQTGRRGARGEKVRGTCAGTGSINSIGKVRRRTSE